MRVMAKGEGFLVGVMKSKIDCGEWVKLLLCELYLRKTSCPHARMLSRFSHVWLCNPMDCNPLGSSVRGILQARTLECTARPSSRGPGVSPASFDVSCTGRWVLYHQCHLGNPISTLGTSKQVNVHSLNFKCLSFLFWLIREACSYGKILTKFTNIIFCIQTFAFTMW